MFRSGGGRNDDDSDGSDHDDLPLHRDSDDPEPAKKKINVWTNVMMEQSLEDKSARVSLEQKSKLQKVNRGTESYDVPKDLEKKREDLDAFNATPILAVTPASDDPFSETVDLAAVEEFGVGPSRTRPYIRRGGGRDRRQTPKPPPTEGEGKEAMETDETIDVGSKEGEGGGGGGGRGRGGGDWWGRGRGRGGYDRGRGFNRGRGGPQGMKRNWNGKMTADPNLPTTALVSKEYSFEALMATEFVQGISIDQMAKEMAQALGEQDPATVIKIVTTIGEEKALKLFEETRQVEAQGGMKVNNNTRRRTPGGVFISLFKSDIDVSTEVKDQIFNSLRQEDRKVVKAKRNKNKNFGESLQEVAALMAKKKAEAAAAAEGNKDLKALPDVSDVMKMEREDGEASSSVSPDLPSGDSAEDEAEDEMES